MSAINEKTQRSTSGMTMSPRGAQNLTELQTLTQNADLGDMTRKHQLAMNGHMGHGRNLSQSIHITEEKERLPGWGSKLVSLQQPKDVRCLPVDQQYHKKFWDHEATQIHMKTTGWFSSHLDEHMGISFEDLEGLSIR